MPFYLVFPLLTEIAVHKSAAHRIDCSKNEKEQAMEETNFFPLGEENIDKKTVYEEENAGNEIFIDSIGDYVLADYQPEIRKILFVESELVPSGRYESGGEMEAGGTVKHRLVYLDGEDTPSSVELTSDYDYTASAGKEVRRAFASERIASVNCRLTGPRKLSIKTKVGVVPHLISEKCLPLPSEKADTELLFREASTIQSFFSECEETLAGEIRLDGYPKEDLRLLSASATAAIRDLKRIPGGVSASGDLLYKLLFSVEGGAPFSVNGTLPIDCAIEGEMPEGVSITAVGYTTSFECNIEESGEGGAVCAISASLLLCLTGRKNSPLSVVSDAYVPEYETSCEEKKETVFALIFAGNRSFPISERLTAFEAEWEDGLTALHTVATPLSYSAENKNGMLTVNGEFRVRTVAMKTTDEGGVSLFPIETTRSFSLPLVRIPSDEIKTELSLRIVSPDVKVENNEIFFRCEMLVSAAVTEEKSLSSVTECTTIGEKEDKTVSLLRIYYPTAEDTLWSVAKGYRVPVRSVADANRLSDEAKLHPDKKESLSGVSRLLIVD